MNKSSLAYSHWISKLLVSGCTFSPSQFKCTFFFYSSWWFLFKNHQIYNIVLICSREEKVDLLYSFKINEFVISTGFSQTCKKPYFQVTFLFILLGSPWHPWNCVFQQTRTSPLVVKCVLNVLKNIYEGRRIHLSQNEVVTMFIISYVLSRSGVCQPVSAESDASWRNSWACSLSY